MTYEDYIRQKKSGGIWVEIEISTALRLIDSLPKRYQFAFYFWSWVWMLPIPAFILVAILWKWWIGLLLLIFVSPIIMKATKKSAAQFVIEYANENKEYFDFLVREEFISFNQKS